MKTEKVKLKKLSPLAKTPVYSSDCAAGADLYAATSEEVTVAPGETVMIGTGIAAQIPDGLVGLVYARSGLATKRGIAPANKVGVIDSDYRGEIKVSLHNHSSEPQTIAAGGRGLRSLSSRHISEPILKNAKVLTRPKEAPAASVRREQNKNKTLVFPKGNERFIFLYKIRKTQASSIKNDVVSEFFPVAVSFASGLAGIIKGTQLSRHVIMADDIFL